MRRFTPRFFWFVAAAAAIWACGADNAEAPRPPPAPQSCKGFDTLMPAFVAVLNSGGTKGLAQVVDQYLLNGSRPDAPAPAVDALRAIFQTFARFASYPPEAGAPPGQVCSQPPNQPPPVQAAHPLCELRRALDTLVHQGDGLAALGLIDPAISGILDYIIGRPPSSGVSHYEVATVISGMCLQSVTCQVNNTLDLVIGLTSYLQTTAGKQLIADGNALVANPALQPFLVSGPDGGQQIGGEDGVVALVRTVLPIIEAMQDPSSLDQIPTTLFPPTLQPDIQALITDAKSLLDPNRVPNVLTPLKQVLGCYQQKDTNSDLIRMVYRLVFVDQLPAFKLGTLTNAITGLQNVDQRGSILYLVNVFATAIRNDPTAPDSTAAVCHALLSTDLSAGGGQSNAAASLPAIDALFTEQIGAEVVCAVDTLIYGCAGGTQPACAPSP